MKRVLSLIMACALIFAFVGCSGVSTEEHNKVVSDLDSLTTEYEQYKSEASAFMNLPNDKRALVLEAAEKEGEIESLNTQIASLNTDIATLEAKKEALQGDIITIKSEGKKYPAGYLVAGTDFDSGRYKIYNGTSNFVVHSSSGDLRVNIILGRGDTEEYIYTFKTGDEIDASSSYWMAPVE